MRFFTTTVVTSMFVALTVCMPAPARADVYDDLLKQVQSMIEEMAKVQLQLKELQATQEGGTQTSTLSGSVLGVSAFKFSEDLSVGVTNADVKRIQQLLKLDTAIYPEGIVSGYYGPATVQAIRNLQTRFGLDAVGVVGPATTALLERLIAEQHADGGYPSDILDPNRSGNTTTAGTTTTENDLVQNLLKQVAELKAQQGKNTTSTKTEDKTASVTHDIDRIEYEYDSGDLDFKVYYEDGSKKSYSIEIDSPSEVVEAIAEELDMDEDDVEDLLDEKGTEVDEISAEIDDEEDETKVVVEYGNGDKEKFYFDETDEDDLIELIAEELDMDEDDVEDLVDFNY